jgi:hypothetical protein
MPHPCTITGKTVVPYILIFTVLQCVLVDNSFQSDYNRDCETLLCDNFIMHLFRVLLMLFSGTFSNDLLRSYVTSLLLSSVAFHVCVVLL